MANPENSHLHNLPSGDWDKLKAIIARFEGAGAQGESPRFEDYLPPEPELRWVVLFELVQVDMVFRGRTGQRPAAASYLERYPELAARPEIVQRLAALEKSLEEKGLGADPGDAAADVVTRIVDAAQAPVQAPPSDPYATQPPAVNAAPFPAAHVKEYEIVGTLGEGGMGVVYKAKQIRLNRFVALKMINRAHAEGARLARFRLEAEAVARLQHPNIVQIFDTGELGGQPYFSLEYVEGENLAQKLKSTPQDSDFAASLTETLARAMQVAHVRGIIHRDLKPANILLSDNSHDSHATPPPMEGGGVGAGHSSLHSKIGNLTPKIADFGLAKLLDQQKAMSETGLVMGTPSYMAPEQARGDNRKIGPVTDVYALGAILYEVLTGGPPFRGRSYAETLDQVRQQEPVPPSRLQPKVPRDLETICLKCLEKEPKRRYASALDLAEDLRRFRHHEPILARPASLSERTVKWVRRRPLVAGFIAMCIFAATGLAAGGVMWIQREISNSGRITQHALAAEAATAALDRREFDQARNELAKAVAVIDDEPHFDHLRGNIERLRQRYLRGQAERQKFDEFKEKHERCRQLLGIFAVEDVASTIRKIRETARTAIGIFGDPPQGTAHLVLSDAHFSKEEMREIVDRSFELRLQLAESLAHPLDTETAGTQADLALAELAGAEKLEPRIRSLFVLRANMLAQKGDLVAAAVERSKAEKVEVKKQHSALDHFLAGQERYKRQDYVAAVRHFEQTLVIDPRHYWAQHMLGECDMRLGRLAEAKARWDACLSRDADLAWIYILRGMTNLRLAESMRGEAAHYFQAAEDDFKEASKRSLPSEAEYALLTGRGLLHIRRKNLSEAVLDLTRAVNQMPEHFPAYVNLAGALSQLGKVEQAMRVLDAIIARDGKRSMLYRSRARLHMRQSIEASLHLDPTGKALRDHAGLDRALEDLRQAINCHGDGAALERAWDHVDHGLLLALRSRHEEALDEFSAAHAAQPDYVIVHRLRAASLIELGRYKEALASLNDYLEKANQSRDAFLRAKEPVAHMYTARGHTHLKLGQTVAAIDDFSHALALNPDALTVAQRGWCYVLTGALRLALADFEKAVDLDPNLADAYNGRGYCWSQLKEPARAIQDADTALRLGGDQPKAIYKAARIYAQAAIHVRTDPRLTLQEPGYEGRERLSIAYQNRALQLLEDALRVVGAHAERRQFWRDHVRTDAAVASLRFAARYAALAQEYER